MAGTEKVYNAEILGAIHNLDKKLVEYSGLIKNNQELIMEMKEDIYDHGGEGGIKFRNITMWAERGEKKKMSGEVKVAILIGVINGLLATGNIFNIF